MSSLAPEYRHSKTQWFVKGNIPAGESGDGFRYGSDIPFKAVFPKEPQRSDPIMLSQNVDPPKSFHLKNYHHKDFQPYLNSSNDPVGGNYKRKQHFIKGQIPGGSQTNRMIYGTDELMAKNSHYESIKNQKPVGFMYGTNAATNVGQSNPGPRPNNALLLEQRNQSDEYQAKVKKLASDKDEFLARHYEEKEKKRLQQLEEKKKDFEMLTTYNPFEIAGGAPKKRGARITRNVEDEQFSLGGFGGGAPNRTESGKVQTKLRVDPALRFPAYGQNTNVNQTLRYGAKGDSLAYKQELDKIVEESRAQKELQRKKSLAEECQHLGYHPFGKQGAGAPIMDARGNVKAGHPLTLSGDSVELRGVEGRHDHAYNQKPTQVEEREQFKSQRFIEKEKDYEPWGRGFGNPVRDQTGRIKKQGSNKTSQSEEQEAIGIPIGRPGAGAPITDGAGNVVTKKNQTLIKDTQGNAYSREFSPKDDEGYNPWGKPGHGNRITNERGKVITQTAGKVKRDTLGSSPTSRNKAYAREELRNELLYLAEEAKERKRREREDIFESGGGDVATWLKAGAVGQPRVNPVTKEYLHNPRYHSDVTTTKLNINRMKNENSHEYYKDLELQAQERMARKMREKEKNLMDERKHVETLSSQWGRPGAGAPLDNAKRKVDIAPTEGKQLFRGA